eukprot:1579051-Rhodomonas_salina.1
MPVSCSLLPPLSSPHLPRLTLPSFLDLLPPNPCSSRRRSCPWRMRPRGPAAQSSSSPELLRAPRVLSCSELLESSAEPQLLRAPRVLRGAAAPNAE